MKKNYSIFNSVIFVLSLLLLSMGSLRAQNPIVGYTFAGIYNNHAYYVSECTSPLFSALDAATEMGGYLVALSDMNENAFVASLVSTDGAWLGHYFYDMPTWLNGEAQAFENFNPNFLPDFNIGSCIVIYPDGYWGPAYAAEHFKYIIEFDITPDCNNPNKQYVCHNGNTICVNNSSVQSHLNHGDYLGPCGGCNGPTSFQAPVSEQIQPDHYNVQVVTAEQVELDFISKQDRSFDIFPNPASDVIHIQRAAFDYTATVVLSDPWGREMNIDHFEPGQNHLSLQTEKLTPGIYFITVISHEKSVSTRVMISRL